MIPLLINNSCQHENQSNTRCDILNMARSTSIAIAFLRPSLLNTALILVPDPIIKSSITTPVSRKVSFEIISSASVGVCCYS